MKHYTVIDQLGSTIHTELTKEAARRLAKQETATTGYFHCVINTKTALPI